MKGRTSRSWPLGSPRSVIFSLELLFRIFAHTAIAKSLTKGLDECFKDPIRIYCCVSFWSSSTYCR